MNKFKKTQNHFESFIKMNKFLPYTFVFLANLGNAHADLIKGVTYFGDAWPINYWNSDLSKADKDFQQIKKEGFNTVTVVVPWGEFQPQIDPEIYNNEALERLQSVCQKAKKNDLNFFMRVSYLWDMYPDAQKPNYQRFSEIFNNPNTKRSWSNYLNKISSATKDCATSAFISWEDYWHNIDRIKSATTLEERKELSKYYGFHQWMANKYPNCKEICKSFLKEDFYYLPSKDSPDFKYVYDWFDDQISYSLLPTLAKYFNNASIEVRVDDDPIFDGKKIIDWYSHKSTYVIKSSEYVYTYWAPAMGAKNIGEKNSAQEVLERFSWINKKISSATNNKIVIAQLLFEDNTPSAIKNAVIKEEEKDIFFKNLAKPLFLQTSGYMLWGGKDYRANMLYNPSFTLKLKGWKSNDQSKIKFITENERIFLQLLNKSHIEQKVLSTFNHFKGVSDKTFLDFSGEGSAEIEFTYADQSLLIRTSSEYKNYKINFPATNLDSNFKIKIKSGAFKLDTLNLYPFTTIANFKNTDGNSSVRYDNIIQLNKDISNSVMELQEISMTKESLANIKGVYGIERNNDQDFTWASPRIQLKMFAKNSKFNINGYLPENINKNNCHIEIYSNGNLISKNLIHKGRKFSIETDLPSSIIGQLVDFTIESDCQVKTSKDKRNLSYILNGIKIKK